MKTFFGKIYLSQLITTCAVMLLMAMLFSVAISVSVSNWNVGKKGDLESLLLPAVRKSYRLSGTLSPAALENALLPYITDSLYVYLFDASRRPLLLLEQGRNRSVQEVEKKVGSLSSFLSLNKPVPIEESGAVIGYLLVDSMDFFAYKANQVFLDTMKKAVAAGALAGVLLSLGLSLVTSLKISRQSSELADTIANPALLEMPVNETGVQEFDRIVKSVRGLQQRLKNEEELRQQWMQDVSHDLRTPLTAVKMQVEGMNDGVLAADKAHFSALYSELSHIERLVLNLQDLSRFESPEMRISPQPVDPGEILADIRDTFSFFAEKKRVVFSCRMDWPEGTPFFCDPFLIRRCLANIVQNAFQYAREGGEVRFLLDRGSEDGARGLRVRILNTGFVAEEDLPRIFNRLYRGDRSRSTAGSGLGLSIAKAVVSLHGGKIGVRNVPSGTACSGGAEGENLVEVRVFLPEIAPQAGKTDRT